jgi:hypothetical protein
VSGARADPGAQRDAGLVYHAAMNGAHPPPLWVS